MSLRRKLIVILSPIITLTLLTDTVLAKSVYAITNHLTSKVSAYQIVGDQISHQTDAKNLEDHADGAVGLGLAPDSEILFVTYESSNIIEMLNARTMTSLQNPTTVPGATSLAGIAFDQTRQKLYVVQRGSNRLYVYLWNPSTKTLTLEGDTYKALQYSGAMGIALGEKTKHLYVTNATKTVHYYNTNNWNHVNSVDVNRVAVGIAADPNRNYLYTGSFSGASGNHPFLIRTDINDINNPTFDEYNVGAYVIGLAADEQTGFIYTTDNDDEIKVFDTATFPSGPCDTNASDIISGPADIIVRGDVSYKPPLFILNKVDDISETVLILTHVILLVPIG